MTTRLAILIEPKNAVFAYDKKKLRAIIRGALGEVAADARRRLSAKAGSGRVYYGSGGANADKAYRGGRHTASAPGQSPASVTGALRRSIKIRVFRSGEGGTVAAAFYDRFLEFGAKGGGRSFSVNADGRSYVRGGAGVGKARVLESRPTLTAALGARSASISQRIRDSIAQDIAFKRQP